MRICRFSRRLNAEFAETQRAAELLFMTIVDDTVPTNPSVES